MKYASADMLHLYIYANILYTCHTSQNDIQAEALECKKRTKNHAAQSDCVLILLYGTSGYYKDYQCFLSLVLHRADNADGILAFLTPNKKGRLKVYRRPCRRRQGLQNSGEEGLPGTDVSVRYPDPMSTAQFSF